MSFTSESSRAMWEARWEQMYLQGRESEMGPAGQKYIQDKYGEEIEFDEPPYEWEDYNDYDFDVEY
jgi:hypothetical protein